MTSPVRPLHPLDFLSTDQVRQFIRNRQADAASREAAQAPEGRGLVHIKTSVTPAFRFTELVRETACETGIPMRHEALYPGRVVTCHLPANPDAFEVDQHLMRLRRLKKNVITSARMHSRQMENKQHHALMVTLTYRPKVDWCPKHITRYLQAVRKWYQRKGHSIRYVWVLELTKAGRPHYHVLLWHPAGRHLAMPKADRRGWWPHGMTNTQKARNAVGYLAKYASKGSDDVMPKGARLYGVGGLSAPDRLVRAWWNLPVSVRRWGFPADRWRRAVGGGWVCRVTGEWRESLWKVQLIAGRVFASPRLRSIPSPFDQLLQALSSVLPRSMS